MDEIQKDDSVTHPSEPGRMGTVETVEFDRRYQQSVYLVRWPGSPWPVPYRSGLTKVLDLDAMKPLELVQAVQREVAKLREATTDDRPWENLTYPEKCVRSSLESMGKVLAVAERKLRGPRRERCPVCGKPIAVDPDNKFVYHGKPKSNTVCPGWGMPASTPADNSAPDAP
jgi:hypothetical protein